MKASFLILNLLVALFLVKMVMPEVEFKNIICTSLDKTFSDFEYCFLKSINRTYKYFSLKVNLFKVPITKVKINLGLYKRLNGYKPFLYNVTLDACKFLKNKKSQPVALYFYEFFRSFSNMNHSCPYDHDLVLEKLSTEIFYHRFTKILPFPDGDYMFQMYWFAYDINRAVFQIYFTKEG